MHLKNKVLQCWIHWDWDYCCWCTNYSSDANRVWLCLLWIPPSITFASFFIQTRPKLGMFVSVRRGACVSSVCIQCMRAPVYIACACVFVWKAGLRNTTWAFLNSSLNGTKIPAGTRGLTCRSSETLTTPSQTGMWRFWLCRREAHSCQWRRPWYSNGRKDPQRGRIKRLNENRHLNSVVCVELYPLHEEALPSDTQVGR